MERGGHVFYLNNKSDIIFKWMVFVQMGLILAKALAQ